MIAKIVYELLCAAIWDALEARRIRIEDPAFDHARIVLVRGAP
jgi:hypothetical protein